MDKVKQASAADGLFAEKRLKPVSKIHRLVCLVLLSVLLIACGGGSDGGLFTVDKNEENTTGSDVADDDVSDTDGSADGTGTADNPGTADGNGSLNDDGPVPGGNDPTLALEFGWSLPVGINTVQGTPIISDAELIITGGNWSETEERPQIKAYSSEGLPQEWPTNMGSGTGRLSAHAEVAGDPNGNIFAIRINFGDGERVRLLTRNASGQQLANYDGGGGQLKTAPSINAAGRVVFTNSVDSVGIRNFDGSVETLQGTQTIGTIRTKPAISQANVAYFTVEGSQGLVAVDLSNGETSNCGALPSWSSPAIGKNGNVIFGTTSGRVMACAPSMQVAWIYPEGDLDAANAVGCNSRTSDGTVDINMTSSPILDAADNVYIRSNNGFIYSLTAEGKIRWCHDTGVPRNSESTAGSPVLTESGHLIYLDMNGISALRVSDGVLVSRMTDSEIMPLLRESNPTPTITPSGLLVYRVATHLVAIKTNTRLDPNAAWPKWGADLRNSGLQR